MNYEKKQLTIEQIQAVSLEILKIIADICEQQKLRYFLIYGTLIGAVRHKGYIPWDDDVDIMMPRPDYDKLLEYLYKNIDKYSNLEVFNHDVNDLYNCIKRRFTDGFSDKELKELDTYSSGIKDIVSKLEDIQFLFDNIKVVRKGN